VLESLDKHTGRFYA